MPQPSAHKSLSVSRYALALISFHTRASCEKMRSMARIVLHIDMDAFFAAVEEHEHPELRGLPIVVGADPKEGRGRGVVSTANYAARKYGIRSALPISKAWEFSEAARRAGEPPAVFLLGSYQKYGAVSRRIMEYLKPLGSAFEEASIDEAYLEVKFESPAFAEASAGRQKSKVKIDEWQEARRLAEKIKRTIKKREGITASVGIGPSKLIAKIAAGFQKPDGLTVVRPEEVLDFLDPLSVREIPGIGPKSEIVLHRHGIRTIADLRKLNEERLVELFGKWGRGLYLRARGIDESPVSDDWERKSIGEQETFERDTLRPEFLLARLEELSKDVFQRFQRSEFSSFRTVTITVRFADFVTQSRSRTLSLSQKAFRALNAEALRLFLPFLDRRENPKRKLIRLLGVRIERLEA